MKTICKAITVAVIVALGVAAVPDTAHAGDKEWATVGKVLTGVAAVGLIATLASQHDRDVRASYSNYGPPPPARWIPGHYEIQTQRICMPGHWETVVEPAQYSWVRRGYRTEYVLIRPEWVRHVWVPERYEYRETRVWIESRYEPVNPRYARAY